jgi:hypothetical protein
MLFSGSRVVGEWIYPIAWWSYVLAVDGYLYRRRGNSLILSRTREFAFLMPASVVVWLLFEWFNLRLENWRYLEVIDVPWIRWPGYFLCFGTVLPALFETVELLDYWEFPPPVRVRPVRVTRGLCLLLMVWGMFSLIGPLIWPLYCFPLIWGGFLFILDPINYNKGAVSLMGSWEEGNLTRFVRLLWAGLFCGVLWEFWNHWSIPRWAYTIPWAGDWKVFEMPLAGFLGFPPFAVECYCLAEAISLLRAGRSWERRKGLAHLRRRPLSRREKVVGWGALLVFCAVSFHAIDVLTVLTWR